MLLNIQVHKYCGNSLSPMWELLANFGYIYTFTLHFIFFFFVFFNVAIIKKKFQVCRNTKNKLKTLEETFIGSVN